MEPHFAFGADWHYFGTGGTRRRHERRLSARRDVVAPTGVEPVFQSGHVFACDSDGFRDPLLPWRRHGSNTRPQQVC